MDLLACPLQRNEGRPLPWRCHLRRDAIVYTQLWEKRQKKHSQPFGIPVMKRDEKRGGGIRRAEAEAVLWFLSFAALLHSFLHSLLQPCAVYGRNITSVAFKLLTFLFAHIAWREISPLTLRMCGASQPEWRQDMLGFTPASTKPLFACTVQTVSCMFLNSTYDWCYCINSLTFSTICLLALLPMFDGNVDMTLIYMW